MNTSSATKKMEVRPMRKLLAVIPLMSFACSGGGGASNDTPAPLPLSGYVLSQAKLDSRTFEFRLKRTADEPLMGLSFDVVFPGGYAGLAASESRPLELLAGGTVGVGIDESDSRRVVVAAGKTGGDSVRGAGDLLSFRVEVMTDAPVGVVPVVENLRYFRSATSGEFAVEVAGTMEFTVTGTP